MPKRKKGITLDLTKVKTKKKIIKRAVKESLNKSVIIKRHPFTGIDRLLSFGTDVSGLQLKTFRLFFPLQLSKSSSNSNADDFNNRESNRIYARNTQFWMNVQTPSTQMEPYQIRIMCGYFKGDDNSGTGQLTDQNLKTLYPEINNLPYTKNIGQRDFYWKYEKVINMCPKQLYNGTAEPYTNPGGDESQSDRALWMPRDFKYNFRFNRLYDYESDEGDSLNGWTPLIAVQMLPLEGGTAFTRPNFETDIDAAAGNNKCPLMHVSMVTYFNDCH